MIVCEMEKQKINNAQSISPTTGQRQLSTHIIVWIGTHQQTTTNMKHNKNQCVYQQPPTHFSTDTTKSAGGF